MAIHSLIVNKQDIYFGKSSFKTNTLELCSAGMELFEDNPSARETILKIKNALNLVLKDVNGNTIRTHQTSLINK